MVQTSAREDHGEDHRHRDRHRCDHLAEPMVCPMDGPMVCSMDAHGMPYGMHPHEMVFFTNAGRASARQPQRF